jgi:hypothetical protein
LILEGLAGDYWQASRASEAASSFSGSEKFALAVADAFLAAESASMWVLYGSVLDKFGVKLPRETVKRLVKALESSHSPERLWALLSALEPYVSDPERVDDASRAIVARKVAGLCMNVSRDGWFAWAIKRAWRDDVAREMAPMLLERLRAGDDMFVEDALRRIAAFGPSMAALLPRLLEVLRVKAARRVRYAALEAVEAMGAAAAPAVPVLLGLLRDTDGDKAADALGAIGPEAAAATEALLKIRSTTNDVRLKYAAERALERITGQRPG